MLQETIMKINGWLAEICGWLLSVMVIFLCLDIISRGLKEPIQGVAEMAVFVMISAVYLGLAHCEQMDRHIRVSVLLARMPLRVQSVLKLINGMLNFVVVAVLIWAAGKNLVYSYTKLVAISGTVPLKLWPVNLIILVGLFFYWLQIIINLGIFIRQSRASGLRKAG